MSQRTLLGALALCAVALGGLAGPGIAADDPSIKGALRENIKAAMEQHVQSSLLDGKYLIYDAIEGDLKRLTYDHLHDGIVNKAGFYVSCADFYDSEGSLYDLDFLVVDTGEQLRVMQAVVHAIDDDKRKYHLEDQ